MKWEELDEDVKGTEGEMASIGSFEEEEEEKKTKNEIPGNIPDRNQSQSRILNLCPGVVG